MLDGVGEPTGGCTYEPTLPPRAPAGHDACMSTRPAAAATRRAEQLRGPVTAAVREVAGRALRAQARLRPEQVSRKGVGDFVTEVDVRCERLLRRRLGALLTDAGFLGEETPAAALDQDWVWVVDPIDGTSNFARGLPQFSVSVALLFRGQPKLGVCHVLPEDRTFVAVHGRGLRRDGRVVAPPRARFDDGAMIGCQWFRGQADMGFLAALQSRGARIRTFGSTVVQLCDCAAGRLDGNVQQQGRLWDFAAAGLIAQEAGLRFTTWTGERVFPLPDFEAEHIATVAARPAVHRQLLELLRPHAR